MLLEGLHHAGMLKAEGFTEHERRPALIFEHDPEAERLDLFLRIRGETLDIDQRLALGAIAATSTPVLYGQPSDQALFIDSQGRVGIGKNNPEVTSDVQGNAHIRGLAVVQRLLLTDAAGKSYADNWIGMADNVFKQAKWLHIGAAYLAGQAPE